MRRVLASLMVCGLLYGCAHATTPTPEIKTSHAHLNADYKVYDPNANAMADVDAALAKAKRRGTKALIIMGANWCHDSRGLAARLDTPAFQKLIKDQYERVYVSAGTNPGQKNQNKKVSQRFGVDQIEGTPTVFIVGENGAVLNSESAGFWRRADTIPTDMSFAYFDMYAKK